VTKPPSVPADRFENRDGASSGPVGSGGTGSASRGTELLPREINLGGNSWSQRAFDVLASSFGLLVSAPFFAVATLAILLEDGLPVLYRQSRVGRAGVCFVLFKLRTMYCGREGPVITAAGDSRVTRIGKLLRQYKLDELPQLWNVLRGEMSLVGPRPEVPQYVDLDAAEWQATLQWRPGITDLATLVYRNEEELLGRSSTPEKYYKERILPDKLALNLDYLRARSFGRDLKLVALSVRHSCWPSSFDARTVKRTFSYKDES
jgi:lipopolysaccharide/colanic/teichoic acid biosynthesis glycosyltransferase